MAKLSNDCTLNHDAHTSFGRIYTFFVNVYNSSNIYSFKNLINQDGEPTTQHKLETVTKTSVSNICALFFPYAVRKVTAHVDGKALNMCHQSQKGFQGIFVGIKQHQKGYLIYVPST